MFCHFQLEMTKITELLKASSNDLWIGNWKEYQKYTNITKTPVLILQIRNACEGLNLQKDFSEIYFVSPNWNPTLEEQAVARCHRIGQQNKVNVFRFYMDSLLSRNEIRTYFTSRIPMDIYHYIIFNDYKILQLNIINH